ncbi:MAG: oligopeptide transporter, OPT family [Thermoplasmata archaeon HGW-Thermoplasmata-1]|nr:MAG: oligopeptide transporter, OPT family [Thermoplasmata archaeon HGW-Thermoplasmata-1]
MVKDDFIPYVKPEESLKELTVRALIVGAILSVIMGAANAYLGLYVGMTVSATIPAAIMSFAILRPFKATILEINIAKTAASAGESLAAGVIFTIPAFLMLKMGGAWESVHYLETTAIAFVGGVLGVLFTIPLRRVLILQTDLPFPEGIAGAAILETADKGGKGAILVWISLAIGAIFKFCQETLGIFKGTINKVWSIGSYTIGGKDGTGYVYGGSALSVALLGVGYIIGPKIASFVLCGGLLGWLVIIPIIALISGIPVPTTASDLANAASYGGPQVWGFFAIWSGQVRYIGVGAMIVGGLWTLFRLRTALSAGVKEAIKGQKAGIGAGQSSRTDTDMSMKLTFLLIFAMVIPIGLVYYFFARSLGGTAAWAIPMVLSIVMVILGFFFAAVAGYLAGLVGSSNNPISGVTVATCLFATLLVMLFGASGFAGAAVALGVAAVICCAAAISGDVMQDLSTGHFLGATPKKQQISEIVGVIPAALVLGLVLKVLDKAYTIGSPSLPAPQAGMMASVIEGIMGGTMVWPYILAGAVIAIILILLNLPIMPVAVGIYLPFYLSAPIMLGGLVRYTVEKKMDKLSGTGYEKAEAEDKAIMDVGHKKSSKETAIEAGLLFSSGLIAGEALMGVLAAGLIAGGISMTLKDRVPGWPGMFVMLFLAFLIGYITLRSFSHERKESS